MRPATDLDLPLQVDPTRATPLHDQIVEQLRAAVVSGALVPGTRVPATRTLAHRLGLSRSTVVAAYATLCGEGLFDGSHGSGTYVSDSGSLAMLAPRRAHRREERPEPAASVADLRPGTPDTSRLLDPAWRQSWWRAGRTATGQRPPDPAGDRLLREALARHLRSARGVVADPGELVVTCGTTEALLLIGLALRLSGATVLVEDPGYPKARNAFRRLGARVVPVPVDGEGMRPDALPVAGAVGAVYVTPSHQYPLGGILPTARRTALLAWARERGALVVEDDYDGEFRFGVAPLPALAALAEDAPVAYVGTLSKTLTPAVRLGYVVAPPALLGALREVRVELGTPVPSVVQHAVADYVASGGLARHVARMRRDYARKRSLVVGALSGGVTLRGADAGLHVVVDVPDHDCAAELVERLASRGVLVSSLADFYLTQEPGQQAGLVLGYGGERLERLEAGLAVVADVMGAVAAARGSAVRRERRERSGGLAGQRRAR